MDLFVQIHLVVSANYASKIDVGIYSKMENSVLILKVVNQISAFKISVNQSKQTDNFVILLKIVFRIAFVLTILVMEDY